MHHRSPKVVVALSVAVAALIPATGSAAPPVGHCPKSFPTQITSAEAEAAGVAALFAAVNKNGDDIICLKPYPKKPGGNVVDNTAGPHS